MKLSINPEYEKLVPRPSKEEYQALKQSIKEDGQRQAIIVNQKGVVLDGHTRFKVCEELGIKSKYQVQEFKDEIEEQIYVIEVNLQRRNLNDGQKLDLGLKLAPLVAKQSEMRLHLAKGQGVKVAPDGATLSQKTSEIVAKKVSLSPEKFERGKAVVERGTLQQKRDVLSGRVPINKAYGELRAVERTKSLVEKYKDTVAKSILGQGDFTNSTTLNGVVWNSPEFNRIADNSIDLIVTDPPYPKEFIPLHGDLSKFASRVLKPGGYLLSLEGKMFLPEVMEQLSKHLTYRWTIAYLMPGGAGHSQANGFIVQREEWKPILWFSKDPMPRTSLTRDAVGWEQKREKSDYEWQQSVTGFEELIQLFSVQGQTVLDPMMGAGTTGIAAVRTKRKFIGIELDKSRYTIAEGKIAEEEKKK